MDAISLDKYKVDYGREFLNEFKFFPKGDQLKIIDFANHIRKFGFENLEGKFKRSDDVNTDDPLFLKKVRKAQEYSLWHYHIGIKFYIGNVKGQKTSEWVLFCRLLKNNIVGIIDMRQHPPLTLPSEQYYILTNYDF